MWLSVWSYLTLPLTISCSSAASFTATLIYSIGKGIIFLQIFITYSTLQYIGLDDIISVLQQTGCDGMGMSCENKIMIG